MLPKANRLPSPEVTTLMRRGRRMGNDAVQLIYRRHSSDSRNLGLTSEDSGNQKVPPRFSFVVSTKLDKRATRRNRMKRLMREAVHHLLPRIAPGVDGVFIGRSGLRELSQVDTEKQLLDVLQKVGLTKEFRGL